MTINRTTRSKSVRIVLGALVAVVFMLMASVLPAAAETSAMTASGTNNATITISLSDATAAYGTNLDPMGTDSNSSDTVLDYQGSTGNQGTYYVWKALGGAGLTVTVKSNKSWNGKIEASENGGDATSMTIASGVLRYSETTAPTSYSDASSATALATSAAAGSWKAAVAKGANSYTHYYSLRVDWNDDPGTFSSTVTYTVAQI